MNRSPGRVVLAVVWLLGLASCDRPPAARPPLQGVNLLIGDESYVKRFGHPVLPGEDEELRVRVHLGYVLEQLRQRVPPRLTPAEREARGRTLEHLEAYVRRGAFPHNHDHPEGRRPTFIDVHGRICAVGYLLEQDLGRPAAEAIAAEFRDAFIREMTSPLLARWAATTGLDLEELELIQPEYSWCSAEDEDGPAFTSLDRIDGGSHYALETGLLFERGREGVPLRLFGSIAAAPESARGLGVYAAVALTRLVGAATSTSTLSDLDLGVSYAHSLPIPFVWGRLVTRAGILLPLGDEDALGASVNRAMAAQRLADAVLYQPGALGGRVGVSWSRGLFYTEETELILRVEAGLDGYLPHDNPWQWSPRWGAGLAYHPFSHVAFTLEGAGARYPEGPSSPARMHYSLAGSLRYIPGLREQFFPSLTVTVPLHEATPRAFVGLDLNYRLGS